VKNKIVKYVKVILPIFIGIYLTWYFISNAITPEKRSFRYSIFETEIAAEDQFSSIIKRKDSSFKKEFDFFKSSSFDELEEKLSLTIAKKIFELNPEELSPPLSLNGSHYLFIVDKIEEEITKEDFINSFRDVNYLWIFLALIVAFLSHLSRAYRWRYLLEPLGLKPKLSLMYHSVMIGYIINLTIPRSGELARAGYFSRYQKSSSEKVFGTIVVERVIDLIMFGLVFIIALFLQTDQETFSQLRQTDNSEMPSWLVPLLAILFISAFGIIIFIPKVRKKLVLFIKGILEGCMTILKLKQKTAFILHTLFIWFAYILMLWLTAFSIPTMESAQVNAIFACFVAGTIAIGATPGGIGLYPIMVASVLIKLYDYPSETANSFGILMWSTQTAFMLILGLFSLFAIKKEN
jgi:hypothetical protein